MVLPGASSVPCLDTARQQRATAGAGAYTALLLAEERARTYEADRLAELRRIPRARHAAPSHLRRVQGWAAAGLTTAGLRELIRHAAAPAAGTVAAGTLAVSLTASTASPPAAAQRPAAGSPAPAAGLAPVLAVPSPPAPAGEPRYAARPVPFTAAASPSVPSPAFPVLPSPSPAPSPALSPPPSPPPAPPPAGQLEVSQVTVVLAGLGGSVSFTALGGPVTWSASATPGLVLSPAGGTLQAGDVAIVMVTAAPGAVVLPGAAVTLSSLAGTVTLPVTIGAGL